MNRADERPLFQRIRSKIVALILDGIACDGDPLPSVRTLASKWGANPLTVAKAYRGLQDRVIEGRRGVGLFVRSGGTARLKEAERVRFLSEDWPNIVQEIRTLGITQSDLAQGDFARSRNNGLHETKVN